MLRKYKKSKADNKSSSQNNSWGIKLGQNTPGPWDCGYEIEDRTGMWMEGLRSLVEDPNLSLVYLLKQPGVPHSVGVLLSLSQAMLIKVCFLYANKISSRVLPTKITHQIIRWMKWPPRSLLALTREFDDKWKSIIIFLINKKLKILIKNPWFRDSFIQRTGEWDAKFRQPNFCP